MNVGVFGGGQLARMLAQAGRPMGMEFLFISPDAHACASPWGTHVHAPYDDERAGERLIEWADVVTSEFEHVPVPALDRVAKHRTLYPSSLAFSVSQDRLLEKQRFRALGFHTAAFAPADNARDLLDAARHVGFPAVLKTRHHGYDGRGQAVVRRASELAAGWTTIGNGPCILESLVSFDREVSIIAVRSRTGVIACYPLSQNYHLDGILRMSISRSADVVQGQAESMMYRLLEDLDYVGVLALELFQAGDRLLVNEMAPRVHNSGHWTMDAAPASQFENHLRAIAGLPLGGTTLLQHAAMVNLIGRLPSMRDLRELDNAASHFYGKAARPGRKVGHVTLTCADDSDDLFDQHLVHLLRIAGVPDSLARMWMRGQNLR